jgi:hypothetical protein
MLTLAVQLPTRTEHKTHKDNPSLLCRTCIVTHACCCCLFKNLLHTLQEILEEPSIHHAEDDSARGYSSTYSKDAKLPVVKPAEAVDAPKDVTMSKDTDGMV